MKCCLCCGLNFLKKFDSYFLLFQIVIMNMKQLKIKIKQTGSESSQPKIKYLLNTQLEKLNKNVHEFLTQFYVICA